MIRFLWLNLFFLLAVLYFSCGDFFSIQWRPYQICEGWKTHHVYYDIKKLKTAANLILFFVSLSFLYTVFKLGLPQTLGGSVLRDKYYISGVETIYLSIYVAIFLYSYILYKTKKIKYVLPNFLIIFILIILKGNKFAFFILVLTFLFFFGKKVKLTTMLLLGIGIIGLFVLASSLYLNSTNEYDLRSIQMYQLGYKLPFQLAFLIDPLVYFSSNIVNLDSLVNSGFSNWGYGIFSFKILWQNFSFIFTNSEGHVQSIVYWIQNILPFPWLNTYSAFGSLFVDFGVLVSIILFSILSFCSGMLDKIRTKKNLSIITLFICLLFYQLLALSFFTFYFTGKEIITNIFVITMVHFFSRFKVKDTHG